MTAKLVSAGFLAFLGLSLPAADDGPAGESTFLSNLRQLTYEGRRSGEGYFSADGKALVFQSERDPGNPFYQIYLLDLESGDVHRVSPGIGKTTCAFFRPGMDQVLFASTHHDPEAAAKQKAELDFRASGQTRRYSWDYDEQFDIFSARRDGSQLRRLTTTRGYDAEAAYSPDGKKIVFCSLRDAYAAGPLSAAERRHLETNPSYFGEIYLMNADGSGQKRLTFKPGYDGGPFFSPAGKRIVWRHFDESGALADIYTMKPDGSDVRRLTDFGCMSWAPYWHPSGKYMIFAANKLGFSNFELYLVDAEGQHDPVRVTHTDGFDGLPVFSPDGKQLCWTSTRGADEKSQLFIADWNDQAALKVLRESPLRRGATRASREAGRDTFHRVPPSSGNQGPGGTRPYPRNGFAPEIHVEDLRAEVAYLASDALEGRMTGSAGARLAADFIADNLRNAGLRPIGDEGTFFQNFEFTAGVRVVTNANHLVVSGAGAISGGQPLEIEKDFRPLSFTANAEAEGEVVFAGYGLFMPGKPGEGYDSYAGLDVTNKIVLVLRYVPEAAEPKRRQELNRYAGLRYKAMIAREHGAKAVLIVTGPTSPNAGALAPVSFDSSLAGSGIVAASVSGNVAEKILKGAGKDLKTVQSALDTENPHAEGGFGIPNVRLRITAAVEHIKQRDRNVLGFLPAGSVVGEPERRSPTRREPDAAGSETGAPFTRGTREAFQEWLIIGAHYDHLGRGETGSREHKEEEGQIHNGADDNASGVAAVLELAARLAADRKEKPDAFLRGIIFAFWSGEELGLMGSTHFVEHSVVALTNIAAYVNFDMVGRQRENKLVLQGAGSSSVWRRLIEKRNVAAGFNLVLQDDPYLPTDVTAFYPKGMPVLSFFTGSHEDYHRPTDDSEKLNYPGLERITRFAHGLVVDLAGGRQRPDYVKVERRDAGGSRDNLRVYLGTIPDYTAEVAGVKLSGVRGGSPADQAGLKGGDVIVEFARQKIANIYDYTYALDAAKIGQPVEIIVMREGKRLNLQVTPEARK
jgi:Tol biopolymer transport system component